MKEIIEIKYYIDKFKLSDIITPELIRHASIKTLKNNTLFLETEEIINNIYIIVDGIVEVSSIMENGKHVTIDMLEPLSILGDIEYVTGLYHTLQNLITRKENTKLIMIEFKYLDSLLADNVHFWKKIAVESADKLIRTNYAVLKRLNNKLEDIIIDLLIESNNEYRFSSLETLAKTLNVSYRNLTRVLKKLSDEKIIKKEKKKIIYLG